MASASSAVGRLRNYVVAGALAVLAVASGLLEGVAIAMRRVVEPLRRALLGAFGMQRWAQAAKLQRAMDGARSYQSWARYAERLDRLNGKDLWKADPRSDDYDSDLISKRLEMLRRMRAERNLWGLVFILRAGLSRNIGGIGNAELFEHSLIDTKKLIEEYVNEVNECLVYIARYQTCAEFTLAAKIDFFASLRRVYGRSALLLSGGATLGMYHLGVIKGLFEHGLLPRIFSGSSAGSLVASLVCTRTDDELPTIFDPANINLNAIERRGEGTARRRIARLLKTGFLFDIKVLQECVRENVGDLTFLEAYNRTRRVLNITVSSSTIYELPRLLNYLTAPNVLVWSAASASCAIPGLYEPVPLMAKTKNSDIVPWNPPGTHWVDGSIENDLPMARLSEQFNVNHFIVSQVNPYVIPFLQQSQSVYRRRGFVKGVQYLISSEIQHRLSQLFDLGIFPQVITRVFYWSRSVLSQTYTGDITIVPPVTAMDYLKLMKNPVVTDVRLNVSKAERATWKKLSIIRMHFQTEKTLDLILYQLRVHQLEKLGRPYRPLDFALALDPLSDITAASDDDKDGNTSFDSIGIDPSASTTRAPAGGDDGEQDDAVPLTAPELPSRGVALAAADKRFSRSVSLTNMVGRGKPAGRG